jgi:ketosteroid isomerase-like protein
MATSSTADTTATVARHIQAVLSRDIEAMLRNFTEESVVFTPEGVQRGFAAIRGDAQTFFATTPPELLGAFQVVRQEAEGEVAYLLWKAEPFVALAAETFVVRGGKIMAQTFAMLGTETPAA